MRWVLMCARPFESHDTHHHTFILRITHHKWAHMRRPNIDSKCRRSHEPEWPMARRAADVAPTRNLCAEAQPQEAVGSVHCAHATPDPRATELD